MSPQVLAPCDSDSVKELGRVTLATPDGNRGCLPSIYPTLPSIGLTAISGRASMIVPMTAPIFGEHSRNYRFLI
jgi:hypothetical protein